MSIFNGLSGFPITPADPAGHVDTAALGRLVKRLQIDGVHSVGLLGSTGTYAYLTRAERQRAIAAAAETLDGAVPLIAGVGALRTDEAQALALDAARAGADGLLLAPVSYTPLTDEEVYQHYATVADTTALPLCIYNNPGTTGFRFGTELLGRLAALPGIAAVKMPLPDDGDLAQDIRRLRDVVPADFKIGYSGDWGCVAALLAGADTWYSVVGGTLPEATAQLALAALAGDAANANALDQRFHSLWQLFRTFGSLRVVYAAVNLMSLTDANPPRPILPLADDKRRDVAAALAAVNTTA